MNNEYRNILVPSVGCKKYFISCCLKVESLLFLVGNTSSMNPTYLSYSTSQDFSSLDSSNLLTWSSNDDNSNSSLINKPTRRRNQTVVYNGPKRPVGRPPKKLQQQKTDEIIIQPSESNSLIEQPISVRIDFSIAKYRNPILFSFKIDQQKCHPQDLQDINVDILTYQMRSVLPSISNSINLTNPLFKQEDLLSSSNMFHYENDDLIETNTLPSINSFMNKKYFL